MKEYVAERPLVSVVIPVYNRMDTIERSINSVLNQTYKNIEIIVIDDGSIDDTLKIIEHLSISDIKVLKQNHRGANAARNLGISAAKGEFIAFQDSDMRHVTVLSFCMKEVITVCFSQTIKINKNMREIC